MLVSELIREGELALPFCPILPTLYLGSCLEGRSEEYAMLYFIS